MTRLSVSHNEMLQLHLMELEPFRAEMEVPKEACQEGISEVMGSGLHNISRALSAMTAEGLVESRLCHVRGAPKRRKAYFLTEKGLQSARSLVKDLMSRMVSLDDGRSIRTVTLGVAMKSLEDKTGQKPNFRDFVEWARITDTLNLEMLAERTKGAGSSTQLMMMSFGRPVVELFEGRDSELAELNEFIHSEEMACALVIGLPGIGKSTLASKTFESQINQRSALWYTVHEWDSMQSVMRMLFSFFPNSSENHRYPDLGGEFDVSDIYPLLVLGLRDVKPIIFLDDVDRAAPNVCVLLGLLCDAVGSTLPSKIVLVSRSVPDFLISGATKFKRMELKCMDNKASFTLASKWEAPDPEEVAEESSGHPLMLRLACELGTEAARGSIDDILGQHFNRVLTPPEKGMLEFLSIIRLPVPARELPGFVPETMASLKRKGLVQEFAEGVAVHKLVRDYFMSRIPPEEAIRMHRMAVDYCRGRTGERWRLEEISQDLGAGDWAKATDIILKNSEELISSYPEESMALASDVPVDRLEPRIEAQMSYVRGRLHYALGNPREAIKDFELSLSILSKETDEALRATVQEFYARTLSESNMIMESLDTHRQALAYYENVKDRAGQIREWMGIGSTWRKAHGLKEAMEAFQTALGIAREQNDTAAVAANLNNLAILEWESGDLRKAEAALKESISEATSARDAVGEGIGESNLADLYLIQLREKESENLRLESAETFRRAGDIVQYKKIKARWAREMIGVGRSGEAKGVLEKVIRDSGRSIRPIRSRRPGNIDDGDLALLMALIEAYRGSGDREKAMRAVETLSQLAKDMEREDLEAQAEMEASLNEEIFGDLAASLSHLKKAEGILREQGNSEGLGAVYLRSGMIRLQLGEKDGALVDLREAARHAERSANVIAYAASLEELGEALGSISPEGRGYLEKARQLRKTGLFQRPG